MMFTLFWNVFLWLLLFSALATASYACLYWAYERWRKKKWHTVRTVLLMTGGGVFGIAALAMLLSLGL